MVNFKEKICPILEASSDNKFQRLRELIKDSGNAVKFEKLRNIIKNTCQFIPCKVKNGDFESGTFDHWYRWSYYWSQGIRPTITKEDPYSGIYCVSLRYCMGIQTEDMYCNPSCLNFCFAVKDSEENNDVRVRFMDKNGHTSINFTSTASWRIIKIPWPNSRLTPPVAVAIYCISWNKKGFRLDNIHFEWPEKKKVTLSGLIKDFRLFPIFNELVQLDNDETITISSDINGSYIFPNNEIRDSYKIQPLNEKRVKYLPSERTYSLLCNDHEDQDFIEDRFEYIKLHLYCTGYHSFCYGINKPYIYLNTGDDSGTQGDECQNEYPFKTNRRLKTLMNQCTTNFSEGHNLWDFTDTIIQSLRDYPSTNYLNIRSGVKWLNYEGPGSCWNDAAYIDFRSNNYTDKTKRPYLEFKLYSGSIFKFYPIGDAYYYCEDRPCGYINHDCNVSLTCNNGDTLHTEVVSCESGARCKTWTFYITFDISDALKD